MRTVRPARHPKKTRSWRRAHAAGGEPALPGRLPGRVREGAVAAAEEHERGVRALARGERVDGADDDEVVAGLVHVADRALDPCDGVVERGAGPAPVPRDARESIDARRREAARDLLVMGGEDVHAEAAAVANPRPGGGRPGRVERD